MKSISKSFIALFSGVLFGLGLSVAQMIDPAKVLAFLDLFGNWDPSLAFVMAGALGVNFLANYFIFKRSRPVLTDIFRVPGKKDLDSKLIMGSCLFGIGWGLAGYCPGPLLTSLSFANGAVLTVVVSYLMGTWVTKFILRGSVKHQVQNNEACVG